MKKNNLLLLIILIITGAVLRFTLLGQFPPSPNWDEVSLGYNSYSLLLTGRDEWGITLPTIFRAYGDFKLPGFVYLLTPFVGLFGLSSVTIRSLSALAGSLSIFLVYFLGIRITKNRLIAIVSAFLMCVSPWSFFVSRVALEANLGLFLFLLGACLLISKRLSLAIVFLGLSAWTYNSFRIFTPLFLIGYLLIQKKDIKLSIIHYLLFTILFVPIFIQLGSTSGQARFYWTTILDSGAIARINELQSRPGGRLVYNKLTYFGVVFAQNYLRHFSPSQLFIKGPTNYQFSVPNHGLLFIVALPFFYLGLLRVTRSKTLALWLIVGPIASSATRDSPHVLRSITMLPIFIFFTSMGVEWLHRKFKVIFVPQLFALTCLILSIFYLHTYTTTYPRDYSWSWQYGHAQVAEYIQNNYENYDQIIITKRYGEPHEFLNFFLSTPPADYQSSPTKKWDYHASWYWVDAYEKFRFVNDWELLDTLTQVDPSKRYLVVSSPDNPVSSEPLKEILFLDGKPAFFINSI